MSRVEAKWLEFQAKVYSIYDPAGTGSKGALRLLMGEGAPPRASFLSLDI
jgi:hypothetical protein